LHSLSHQSFSTINYDWNPYLMAIFFSVSLEAELSSLSLSPEGKSGQLPEGRRGFAGLLAFSDLRWSALISSRRQSNRCESNRIGSNRIAMDRNGSTACAVISSMTFKASLKVLQTGVTLFGAVRQRGRYRNRRDPHI